MTMSMLAGLEGVRAAESIGSPKLRTQMTPASRNALIDRGLAEIAHGELRTTHAGRCMVEGARLVRRAGRGGA